MDGVLLHGWNFHNVKDDVLDSIWREASLSDTPDRQERGNMYRYRQPEFIIKQGWQQIGTIQQHHYFTERTPAEHISRLEARVWSHTWTMSDAQIAAGVQAMRQYLADHHIDPHQPQRIRSSFHVAAFRPSR